MRITARAERIIEIVKKVNSPWVGVNLDTGNFKTKVYQQIEMLAPMAVNVQVKSDIEDETGKHESDWDRVGAMLKKTSYKGYLALEYEASRPPMEQVPLLLKKLKAISAKYSS